MSNLQILLRMRNISLINEECSLITLLTWMYESFSARHDWSVSERSVQIIWNDNALELCYRTWCIMTVTADYSVSVTADLPALEAVKKQKTEWSKRLFIQSERTDAHVSV